MGLYRCMDVNICQMKFIRIPVGLGLWRCLVSRISRFICLCCVQLRLCAPLMMVLTCREHQLFVAKFVVSQFIAPISVADKVRVVVFNDGF